MKKDLNYYLNLPYKIIVKKLTKEEGGGYFARYKDYPYIMGDGESEAEAIADVKSAFSGAVELMLAEGDFIREPETKTIRVNISLPKSLLEAIDKVASNRSAFLANAASRALAGQR
ncbi:type II toxin-antitoxin system HicB family antitoxin [Campylobacter curvus]|uniref:type II toxin-antitoxin system HicB family antitoxin n=1 Tax=Campylobacter curvus TaxID=200 RepID=UPI0014702D39|nr:type II toxin-antitoxin system HicB family antitoxin [Campylobacter curvus]